MSKLIPMEQAASMLGMSVDQINELRSNQEIFGYKDGGTWKFKMTELERVADNLGVTLGDADAAVTAAKDKVADSFDDLDFGDSEELLLDDDSSADSMELDIDEDASVELAQSKKGSDVLSDPEDGVTLQDSGLLYSEKANDTGDDLVIGNSGEVDLGASGSLKLQDSGALELGDSGDLDLGGSGVLDDDDQLSFGTSDISLASGSSKKIKSGDDTGSDVLDGEGKASGSPSDTGKMLGEAANDDLLLAEDDLFEDDLVLQDSASFQDSSDLGSDFDESDLILDDSDSSSELALEANKSGISLSPNESGISLGDEPLELGGSDIDQLELPEDDMIVLEDVGDSEAAGMMQEDDFNLTPLEQSLDGEDSSGSSSQVIALEDSEIYADESEATILGESDAGFGAEPAIVDDSMGMGDAGFAGAGAMIPGAAAEGAMMQAGPTGPAEAPYSVLNIVALGGATLILFLGAILAFDTCRNLWVGDGQVVSSGFLNTVIDMLGMKN